MSGAQGPVIVLSTGDLPAAAQSQARYACDVMDGCTDDDVTEVGRDSVGIADLLQQATRAAIKLPSAVVCLGTDILYYTLAAQPWGVPGPTTWIVWVRYGDANFVHKHAVHHNGTQATGTRCRWLPRSLTCGTCIHSRMASPLPLPGAALAMNAPNRRVLVVSTPESRDVAHVVHDVRARMGDGCSVVTWRTRMTDRSRDCSRMHDFIHPQPDQ